MSGYPDQVETDGRQTADGSNTETRKHFEHLADGGPVHAYLTELGVRQAAAMETLVGGTPDEQARARGTLARCNLEYALVRQFDDEYHGRAWCVGHAEALKQVSREQEAMIRHHSQQGETLLQTLEGIRTAYDQEYRRASAVAPSSSAE